MFFLPNGEGYFEYPVVSIIDVYKEMLNPNLL